MQNSNSYDVIIIGSGSAGTFLAMQLDPSLKVLIVDKNPEILTKFLMTGAGHANLTNLCDPKSMLTNFIYGSPNFIKYALNQKPNLKLVAWLKDHRLDYELKKETKVHLLANNTTVRKLIKTSLESNPNLTFLFKTSVTKIEPHQEKEYHAVFTDTNQVYYGKNVVVATGGRSFSKATGCTGDGYRLGVQLGHTVTDLFPMGTPITLNQMPLILAQKAGLSLPDCVARVKLDNKLVCCEQNDLMVTHEGLGGPLINRISGYINHNYLVKQPIEVHLDLIANKDQFISHFHQCKRFHELWKNYPQFTKKFINSFYEINQFNAETDLKNLTKQQQKAILDCFFDLKLDLKVRDRFVQNDFEIAICTGGGIATKDIQAQSYESNLVPHLYFIGEVLDVNAKTGGFNLTFCYTSAFCCAQAINRQLLNK